jgi:TPR repeat protein
MEKWYYAPTPDEKRGPLDTNTLMGLINAGIVTRGTNIRNENAPDWVKAGDAAPFSARFAARPAVPPPYPFKMDIPPKPSQHKGFEIKPNLAGTDARPPRAVKKSFAMWVILTAAVLLSAFVFIEHYANKRTLMMAQNEIDAINDHKIAADNALRDRNPKAWYAQQREISDRAARALGEQRRQAAGDDISRAIAMDDPRTRNMAALINNVANQYGIAPDELYKEFNVSPPPAVKLPGPVQGRPMRMGEVDTSMPSARSAPPVKAPIAQPTAPAVNSPGVQPKRPMDSRPFVSVSPRGPIQTPVRAVTLAKRPGTSKSDPAENDDNPNEAVAQYNLGVRYYNGTGVTKDKVKAIYWFRKAAEQGDACAQYNLGCFYANGNDVIQDEVEAVRWYRMAAEQGYAPAQSSLGVRYANGSGIARDEAEALRWYRKAADQGDVRALYNLGCCYASGRGVNKDEPEAVKWFKQAAAKGDQSAQSKLKDMGLSW